MIAKALVLCAGYGTRLGQLTRNLPKPLLPLQGAPLLSYTLRHLHTHGINRIAINLHYMAEMIREQIGDGSRYGVKVHYQYEPELLGTAGSVRNLLDYFQDSEDILVIYGDLLFDEDLTDVLDFHRQHRADGTLLVHRRNRSNSRVRLAPTGRITGFEERPKGGNVDTSDIWVNSGIQVLRRDFVRQLPERIPLDLPRDVYAHTLTEYRYFARPVRGYRCAIDSPERYRSAEQALRSGKVGIAAGTTRP
ncbi:MAG: nucleotidyltransferase family protein [Myxococcales bacterium]|nr:nucleotidyltransferase family protein [Myxococcales bacterium]